MPSALIKAAILIAVRNVIEATPENIGNEEKRSEDFSFWERFQGRAKCVELNSKALRFQDFQR